jgi:hypothetical protein
MENIITKSTSRTSMNVSDFVLRETNTTRLIFRPEIVDNHNDSAACVKGCFIFQKKGLKENWVNCNDFPLSKLKASEWIKLELKSAEVLLLLNKFKELQSVFQKYGIVFGQSEFRITRGNAENVLAQLSRLDNKEVIWQVLQNFRFEDLQNLNYIVGIGRFKAAIKFWNANKNNGKEDIWQSFLKENSWVISQVFSYPAVLFQDKAYVGGKRIDNTAGNIIDFIYQNHLTKNIALVEIKTPTQKLLGCVYRGTNQDNSVYSISTELAGAVSQILNYKDVLQKDFYRLVSKEKDCDSFSPKGILVIGNSEAESFDKTKMKSFELFRSNSKDVEIITFNELFGKIKLLLELLEKK